MNYQIDQALEHLNYMKLMLNNAFEAVEAIDTNCEECNGDGDVECENCDGIGELECDACGGAGRVYDDADPNNASFECPDCEGTGDGSTCDECEGDGTVSCSECNGTGKKDEDEIEELIRNAVKWIPDAYQE